MKKILKTSLILIITIALVLSLTGCGKEEDKPAGTQGGKGSESNTAAPMNLSESYGKFTQAKGDMITKIIDGMGDNVDFTLSMTLLGVTMVDLAIFPASVCGLDEVGARAGLSIFFENIDYKDEGNGKYTITYKNAEGDTGKFVANYDVATDSVQVELYDENNTLSLRMEYIKIAEGYAAQYYMVSDGEGSVYKIMFTSDDVSLGIFEATSEPNSIYKGSTSFADDWTKGGSIWAEHKGGVTKSIVDGTEKTY